MRRAFVNVLVGLAGLLLIVGMVAVWADRLLLNPSRWEQVSGKLLTNPTIRTDTANYLADQVDARLNLSELSSAAAGSVLGPLASAGAAGVRAGISRSISGALDLSPVQALWAQANRVAATALVAIVDRPPESVSVTGNGIGVNLGPILRAAVTGAHLPGLVADAVPSDVELPLVRSTQVHTVRTAGRLVRNLSRWVVIAVPLLWLLALALSGGWRRWTLTWIGITAAVAGALVLAARALLVTPVADAVSGSSVLRPLIAASITTVTSSLAHIAVVVGIVGLAVAVIAGVAGLSVDRTRY